MAKEKQEKKINIAVSFLALLRSKDNINIRNVRAGRLKYMLIFPLAPVFANMQGVLFSDSVQLLGLDAMTLMGSAYCVGAGGNLRGAARDGPARAAAWQAHRRPACQRHERMGARKGRDALHPLVPAAHGLHRGEARSFSRAVSRGRGGRGVFGP